MGRLIDTSDLNNQIMLQKDRFGCLSVPICNIFEDMIRDTPTANSDNSVLEDIKAEIIHSIVKQYSEHNEVVPNWLSIPII